MPESAAIDLLCQLPHAASLQQLCDLACAITGNPVFISDLAHTILAYTKSVEVPDPSWQERIVSAHLDRNTIRQDREVGAVHVTSAESQRPVLVDDGNIPFPRIIKTLVRDGQAVGVMVLTAYLQPFGPHDLELVDLIASFAVPCLMRERYHFSTDNRAVENYFIKLLDGAVFPRERVVKRLDVLGYLCQPCLYVLVACARDDAQRDNAPAMKEIQSAFAAALGCSAFLYNSSLVCVYGTQKPVLHWPDDVPGLAGLLDRWSLAAGVSRCLPGPERLREHYQQALDILEMGRRLGRLSDCFAYDSLSSFLLFDSVPREKLELCCHQQIQALGEYDRQHNTNLCATLQVYLEQAKSLARTADILFIHRNTVRYRIQRCMELLGDRLEDGNEIFAYILSLRILEYQRKILSAPPPGGE